MTQTKRKYNMLPDNTTLHGIVKWAERNYKQHGNDAHNAKRYNLSLAEAVLKSIEALPERPDVWNRQMPGESNGQTDARIAHGRAKGNLQRSAEHYREYEAEYTELGIILAHMDGKKINVEQTVEIGQRIDVQIPGKSTDIDV